MKYVSTPLTPKAGHLQRDCKLAQHCSNNMLKNELGSSPKGTSRGRGFAQDLYTINCYTNLQMWTISPKANTMTLEQ